MDYDRRDEESGAGIGRECEACGDMFDGTIDDTRCDYCEGVAQGTRIERARNEAALRVERGLVQNAEERRSELLAEVERLKAQLAALREAAEVFREQFWRHNHSMPTERRSAALWTAFDELTALLHQPKPQPLTQPTEEQIAYGKQVAERINTQGTGELACAWCYRPLRETFDPEAVRALLGCIEATDMHGWWNRESTYADLLELGEAVAKSERKP